MTPVWLPRGQRPVGTHRRHAAPGTVPEVGFDAGLAESVTHVRMEAFDGPRPCSWLSSRARQSMADGALGGLAEAYLDALVWLEATAWATSALRAVGPRS